MKDLNLIPKSYILAKRRKVKRARTIITAAICIIIVAVCVIIPLFLKHNLQKQLNAANLKVEETSGYKISQQRLDNIKQKYSERETIANGLAKYGLSAVTLLEKIEKGVTEKLFITNLDVGGEGGDKVQVSLVGIAATEDDIASFVLHLREDKYYSDIFISSIKKTGVQNSSSSNAIIGNTIKTGDKDEGIKPTPRKAQASKKNNEKNKTVEKIQSTPTPDNSTCYTFNISLYLKIKK